MNDCAYTSRLAEVKVISIDTQLFNRLRNKKKIVFF